MKNKTKPSQKALFIKSINNKISNHGRKIEQNRPEIQRISGLSAENNLKINQQNSKIFSKYRNYV